MIIILFSAILPEAMKTLCERCLPIHIERFKEITAYACQRRKSDVMEIQKVLDPDGSLKIRFEEKYGKLAC